MKIRHGKGTTEFGPGVDILLTGEEVANAIDAYLVARGVHISGPRTIMVNGDLCRFGRVYVDPSGAVVRKGRRVTGRGETGDSIQSREPFCQQELRGGEFDRADILRPIEAAKK